jgi:hypothetical protein
MCNPWAAKVIIILLLLLFYYIIIMEGEGISENGSSKGIGDWG